MSRDSRSGLDKARAALIGMFMESYLKLTKAENAVYNRQLRELGLQEQEAVMQYTNPWIEEGKELGREEGLQEGRQEGRKTLIVRQLRRRFGQLPLELLGRIASLSEAQMDEFGEAIFDFQSLADADVWIAARS